MLGDDELANIIICMILAVLFVIQESFQGDFLERLVLQVLLCMFAKVVQLYTFVYPHCLWF